jgi:uncharacterized Zn finger protein (UPF0148 family)
MGVPENEAEEIAEEAIVEGPHPEHCPRCGYPLAEHARGARKGAA